jgi:hypothetical protein
MYEEIKLELATARKDRTNAQNELTELFTSADAINTSEYAWNEIVRAVTGIQKIQSTGNHLSPEAAAKLRQLNVAAVDMQATLANQEIRRKIASLMPAMISKLIIDAPNKRYAVKTVDGATGRWRNLKPILTAITARGNRSKLCALRINGKAYWDEMTTDQRRQATEALRAGLKRKHAAMTPAERSKATEHMREVLRLKRQAMKCKPRQAHSQKLKVAQARLRAERKSSKSTGSK